MLKRSLIFFALGAKALLMTVGLLSLSSTAAAGEDYCPGCLPPPCYPDEPCWNEC